MTPGFVLCDPQNPIKTGTVFDAQVSWISCTEKFLVTYQFYFILRYLRPIWSARVLSDFKTLLHWNLENYRIGRRYLSYLRGILCCSSSFKSCLQINFTNWNGSVFWQSVVYSIGRVYKLCVVLLKLTLI